MRVIGIVLAFGVVLAACSGGSAAPSAAAPSAAAPSLTVSEAPSEVPSVEPSVAVESVEPSASAVAGNCMDPAAYLLLSDTKVDWSQVSAENRELVASALEAYEFEEGKGFSKEYLVAFPKLLRAGDKIGMDMQPFGLWSGRVVIVSC